MKTEILRVDEVPEEFHDEVCAHLKSFVVGITRLVRDQSGERSILIGSGTLVRVNGLPCVLTADHVLAELRQEDGVNLLTDFSGGLKRHAFDQSRLEIIRIARGKDDEVGPDLGVIILPEAGVGSLSAEKSFYNIDRRVDRFATEFERTIDGMWFNIGVIGEGQKELPDTEQFKRVTGYMGLCGMGANPDVSAFDGFEFLETRVTYGEQDIPRSFGGMSGSGFWQVPIAKSEEGKIRATDYILSGVTFYQTGVERGRRRLRSHGRDAIYRVLPKWAKRHGR